MKKTYSKPELYAESFTLVEHIATLCSTDFKGIANHADENSCYFYDAEADKNIFVDGLGVCTSFEDHGSTYFTCHESMSDETLSFAGS